MCFRSSQPLSDAMRTRRALNTRVRFRKLPLGRVQRLARFLHRPCHAKPFKFSCFYVRRANFFTQYTALEQNISGHRPPFSVLHSFHTHPIIGKLNKAFEVVLWAARQSMGPNEHVLPPTANVGDWNEVLDCASKNTLIPLLASTLKDDARVPLAVRRNLDRRFTAQTGQTALLVGELGRITSSFRATGIDVLAYKGPALAMLAYGNLYLRNPSYDIDLLLRPSDIPKAKELITDLGYRLTLSPEDERHFLKHRYHLHFQREKPEIQVELHWALTPSYWPFPLDYWSRTCEVPAGGITLRTLDPECTLLALCAHGAKEGWPRLSQIVDLAHLIQAHPELDWNWVSSEAQRMRRKRVLRLGLSLAEWVGAPIPQQVKSYANADPSIHELMEEVVRRVSEGIPLQGSNFHKYAMRVWCRPSDRFHYLRHVLRGLPDRFRALAEPSAEDRKLVALPASLWFLYVLIRPVRAVYKKGIRFTLWRIRRNI